MCELYQVYGKKTYQEITDTHSQPTIYQLLANPRPTDGENC